MGCCSSKDVRDACPLQTSKVVSFQLKCKICYTRFDREQAEPMVIPCGHTLCRNCLNHVPKSECPYDRIKFDKAKCQKNYQILGMLDQQAAEGCHVPEESKSLRVVCNNKHKTTWSGVEEICSVCHQNGPGFKCQKCSYNRCNKCVKLKPTRMCFNGHKTKWSGSKMRCVTCRDNAAGWQCIECQYCYCHTCSQTHIELGFCPNGHSTIWNPVLSLKSNCAQCKQLDCGFVCEKCEFIHCKNCSKTELTHTKCPNNHLTRWLSNPKGKTGNLKCQTCNRQGHGFSCEWCCYTICTDCCNWKFQFNSSQPSVCPNNHDVKWTSKLKTCINKCGKPQSGKTDGFLCSQSDCGFQLCRLCSKLKPVTRVCFNQHLTAWSNTQRECTNCSKLDSGWFCQDCNSFFCSSCTNTVLLGAFCPNLHKKVWNKKVSRCDSCQESNHGWSCDKCNVFSCSVCQKTDLCKECPNKHEIVLDKEDVECIVCKELKPGWKCNQCSYRGCLDCVKGKINSVSCPYYHPLFKVESSGDMRCKRCKSMSPQYLTCNSKCIVLCNGCADRK